MADRRGVLQTADRVIAVEEGGRIARIAVGVSIVGLVVRPRRVIVVDRTGTVVIGRLVPLVFRREEPRGVAPPRDGHQRHPARRAVEQVRAILRRAVVLRPGRPAVVQPVGESGRVAPGDIVHRTVPAIGGNRVAVVPRGAAPHDLAPVVARLHVGAVQSVGVLNRHGVEELGVLPGGHLVLADPVRFGHAAVPVAVRVVEVARVAHGHRLDRRAAGRGNQQRRCRQRSKQRFLEHGFPVVAGY